MEDRRNTQVMNRAALTKRVVGKLTKQEAVIGGIGNNDVKSLFVGATSAVCSTDGQITVNKFGFSTISTCGAITLTGSLITGIK